jgi:tRNA1(Val) A37 N6-methylase TrmN6
MISGIDIQPQYIDLANKNIELNKNTERIEFLYGDVLIYRVSESSARYDHVLCNPPFLEGGTYTPSPDPGRATALGHGGQEGGLQDWIDCAFHNLKNGGVLTLIHRADHIDRIIRALGKKFGGVAIIPLYSKSGDPAKRVVVRAVKDSKAPAILHPGLVLHNPDGSYSAGADEILRGGRPLALP